MEKAFEDFFNQHFDTQENVPNPFDKEAFAQFISDQIKNAVPNQANVSEPNNLQNVPNPSQHRRRNRPNRQSNGSPGNGNASNYEYNVFETHDFVIARIAMTNANPEQRFSVLLNSHELFLREKGQRPSLRIHLPKPVDPKKTKITTRNDILEIQMMKQPPEPLSEFDITELNEEDEEW
ncbi:Hsp20/alpha crystallin family protein [Lentibacillus sp. Marseille-P4043]|uniref:Hsp20/alpha crystallin family protein n=1 Tax=Lentibacillus sp. Marseille-P4043 TaxID=2040293 RepID=UPI000D0B1656|nr:Hsp20/alpha crystallin family protein [Lentibacillus sp. Marseille-P4043]